jgi:hypothetical protein
MFQPPVAAISQPSRVDVDRARASCRVKLGRSAGYGCDGSLLAARLKAMYVADDCGIPQTVFCNDIAGWMHTNPFDRVLKRSEVFETILPHRYFL